MFIRAAELARAAEALVLELRSEMEALRAHIEERQEVLAPPTEVETARSELEDARGLVRVADAQLARRTSTSRS